MAVSTDQGSRNGSRGGKRVPARPGRLVRRARLAGLSAGLAATTIGLSVLPSAASAQLCTVTVTVAGGIHLNFQLNLAPGTPLSSLSLPTKLPILGVTESCAPVAGTPTATVTVGSSGQSGTTGTGMTKVPTTVTKAPTVTKPKPQKATVSKSATGRHSRVVSPAVIAKGVAAKPKTVVMRGNGGVPTSLNPTFSFALPGAAPIGVPNFFIDSFRIPPFLLPIYQAAGIEYDIPWQILAAINEIETDYGRNLSVSSAGAVGWMQFLPSTWKQWGVAATGNGIADPYNPVDAIFSAARYLHAAGASSDLAKAIYAYNHATWYVQSVLLRARLIGGIPSQLVGALSGLVQGHFPVAATATYADDTVEQQAMRRAHTANPALTIGSSAATGTAVYAKQGSPVIAANDGKILRIGKSAKLGRFIVLQDQTGNVYTYSNLGQVPRLYAVPRATPLSSTALEQQLAAVANAVAAPTHAATAGTQRAPVAATPAAKTTGATKPVAAVTSTLAKSVKTATAVLAGQVVKERLFAHPEAPAAYAAGGAQQIQSAQFSISSFKQYFSDALHLAKNQYTLAPLRPGAIVVAGTILGRLGGPSATQASHLYFQIQPAGKGSPLIDPKPILDGWKLLEATALYRANGLDPFFGPGARNPTIGQVLLMSKQQLQERILRDTHVNLDPCTSREVQAGSTDRRILAVLEFLSASGLNPTASDPACLVQTAGPNQAATAAGSTIDITRINAVPVVGHQGNGSITDVTIRRLLTLQSSLAPSQIISLMTYKGQTSTLALPDHNNRIQIAYTPLYGQNSKLTSQLKSILKPGQWIDLISRISQIPEPTIPTATSAYAIKTGG
jgi:hypothetical protein